MSAAGRAQLPRPARQLVRIAAFTSNLPVCNRAPLRDRAGQPNFTERPRQAAIVRRPGDRADVRGRSDPAQVPAARQSPATSIAIVFGSARACVFRLRASHP